MLLENKIKVMLIIALLTAVISYMPFYDFSSKEIVPNDKEFISFAFSDVNLAKSTDSLQNFSQAEIISKHNELKFRYILRDASRYFFAGVFFGIKDTLKQDLYDISEFNQLRINFTAKGGKSFPLSILTFEDGVTNPSKELSFRRNTAIINLEGSQKEYTVDMDDFITPDWWYANTGVSSQDLPAANYSKVRGFGFANCIVQQPGGKSEITIHSVVLSHNNSKLFLAHIASVILVILMWIFIVYVRRKKLLAVAYEKVHYVSGEEQKMSSEERLMKYISVNYVNPDFSLKMVSKEVGIPSYIVSKMIKQKHQMSFKRYLNFIRLEESKRLLSSSDLTVNEIAYKTGYNNPSHFRRIFKQEFEISPLDYRKSQN